MISIVVCSNNDNTFTRFNQNVCDTIGVEYELIKIDNPNGEYSICEAYNIGFSKAKFDIICFVHEDVAFESISWGNKILGHFRNNVDLGLIGVAGSIIKSSVISSWWQPEVRNIEPKRANLIQGYKYVEKESEIYTINPENELLSDVTSVDGVFLATTRKVLSYTKFDEKLLKKFHGYDLDFSLAVAEAFRVVVAFDILITHHSEGNMDITWFEELRKVHQKWSNKLPIRNNKFENSDLVIVESQICTQIARHFHFDLTVIFQLLRSADLPQFLKWKLFIKFSWLNFKNKVRNARRKHHSS